MGWRICQAAWRGVAPGAVRDEGSSVERRTQLRTAVLGAAELAAPRIGRAESASVFRFAPHVDLAILEPMGTTESHMRVHGHLVFDALYAQDSSYRAQSEMVDGH